MGLGTYISFQTLLSWVPSQKTNTSQLEKFGKSSTRECRALVGDIYDRSQGQLSILNFRGADHGWPRFQSW